MIEINLLPDELKARLKQKLPPAAGDMRRFLFILPAATAVLACLHIYLAAANIGKNAQLRSLTKKWQAMSPQKKQLDDFNKNYAAFSDDIKAIQKLAAERTNWPQKLARLSLDLPEGIWFRQLVIKSGVFTLEGSVLSLQDDEMGLIKEFIDALKSDAEFYQGFESLELVSVQRKALGNYSVADFVLSAKITAR